MEKRIVTAVKQRFSIRKLSIGAASVLLGTSLYFMGVSAPVVHADTIGEPAASSEKTESSDPSDPVSVAKDSTKSDVDVNNAIDQYAEDVKTNLENNGNKVIIRPSDKQPVTVNTTKDRANQVNNIKQKIDQANQSWDAINTCQKSNNQQIKDGKDSDYFENQSLSVDDEKKSEINQITVDGKGTTLLKGQSKNIDGIDIIHTTHMTDKEREAMKVNSNNKVIVNFQPDQCSNKEITVTYDNLNNSYYLENINDETSRIKISRIDRTFSSIQAAENPKLFYGGWRGNKYDNYDPCNGPQLIIYNDPSDGFFYNNIQQISVKDTYYYDDKGTQKQISFDTKDPAWIFVTSLNSNGGGNIEKVRAVDSNNSPLSAQKIAGSTVTDHNDGWHYSDNNNNFSNNANNIFGQKLDWDNNDEYNRFGFVGTVAFQYQPGMTLQYRSDDSQWGSHWACMQTQVVSSLNDNVIICDHIKDKTESVTGNGTVTRTIHYLYDNGKTAKPDKTQTVSFNVTGTKDDVTGKTTWDDDAQTVDSVTTPSITGYTPDKDKVEKRTFKFGDKDVEATVTYTANTQTAKITYIDDTTKTNLDSKDASGKFGQTIIFATAPAAEIAKYEKKGYVLVSDDFDNQTYQADNSNNSFEVHFKHGTVTVTTTNPQEPCQPINDHDPQGPKYPADINNTNKDVNRTIDYKFKDGKTAQPTISNSLHFERTVVIDKVTGEVTSDIWTPSQNFNDIQTPSVQGYTPDKTVVSDKNIGHDHQDIVEHVVYNPDKQQMTITYIDNTTGETLHTDKPKGVSDQDSKYTTSDTIKKYEGKHYKLVSDSTKGHDLIFDHDDGVNQTYEVHLAHDTQKVNRQHTVTLTIDYKFEDDTTAQPTVTKTKNFSENGTKDLVTGKTTWDEAAPQTFEDVTTPKMTGYTPDKDKVEGCTVNFDTPDRKVTVTYSPDDQLGHIDYIDDTTGKTLVSDNFLGKTNGHENYKTTDRIQEFKNKGYELVSSDYPDGGFNFDDNDQQEQVFNVHLKHGTVTVTTEHPQTPNTSINPDPQSPKYPKDINNTNKDVNRTIDYKFKDGKTAQPTVNDSLHFERTVVIDKVTGEVTSDTWTPSQNFNDIQTPAIQGYTLDKTVVSDKNIGHDHQDIVEHVAYSPDKQQMTITYIDDTTGETLHTDTLNDGVSDQDSKYTTSDTIKKYEDKHYKLVSDSTKGQDLIFDHDDNANQTYEVHFAHNTHAIDQTSRPKQTIHYVYADGLARHGKVTDDNVQQLSFTRDGYNDEVTGLDYWNAWTPVNSQYETVDSPVIQGYTPDKLSVGGSTVNPTDEDTEITVTYNANKQVAHVIYVDKTANTTLDSNDLSGKSDKDSEYNTEDKIRKYKSQHYVLFEDETNGKNVIFDHNNTQDQTYYVYLVHDTQKVNRQGTVTETIDYKFEDGKTAQPTVTQTKHFSENGVKDLVTGKTTWDEVTPQKFEDVATKSIVGYTPDKDNVVGSTVKFGDDDVEVTVHYIANAQTAKITYIDDTEKKTLGSDQQNGKFDHEITFEHDPAEVVKGLKEKGYKLVSDNFKSGTKYQADNKSNSFEVHLVHTYEPVETSQTITETVHYIDANGKLVAPDHAATVVVKMTGTRDKVTNSITWNTSSTGHFDEVISPEVPNMTPDKKFIPSRDVRYGDSDITENVIYTLDEIPGGLEKPNNSGDSTSKTPEKPNKPDNPTSKAPKTLHKSGNPTSKTPEKPDNSDNPTSKTPKKPHKSGNSTYKAPKNKQFGTTVKTTITEKPIDNRTVDNHVSAKSTAKRELPQTGATTNTGILIGLVSMIVSLGLLVASKKLKKN